MLEGLFHLVKIELQVVDALGISLNLRVGGVVQPRTRR